MYELHFGVPMAGAILCTLNIRHDASMLSILLKHSGAKVIFVDYQFLELAQEVLILISQTCTPPQLVLISELLQSSAPILSAQSEFPNYETLLREANPNFTVIWPIDECLPISINYTSGTTSRPKGVVYTHRGAFLNALVSVLMVEMGLMPVFLWTVPMFHCNGWCFTWGVAAQGGANVCIRNVTPEVIFESIAMHKVTHMGGAPTVLNMLIHTPREHRRTFQHKAHIIVGAAPPPTKVLFAIEEMGFSLTHSYGLTETYGPATVCAWKPDWDALPLEQRARLKSRQGLHHLGLAEVDVKDPVTMKSVPADGKSLGEVMFRGNTIMSGYYKNGKATQEALAGGWFRSGDLGVRHPDGYIELKDRSKDIIISGGENISTIEVESVLYAHNCVFEAAVVGRPDEHWGETPCAFVKLKEGFDATKEEIIAYCREKLPHYMVPKTVVFGDLLKTSTGKIQKFVLKERAKAMGSLTLQKKSKL
ncbi:probable acyl-activating enzyme 1, peroxisomal isoform X2 [Amborella trichopoda]|uniref:4-coumarate--CoA ligase n=2 Tax=Amborella trichopoda TaxID=13333 RepID=U5D8N3_AMBTC|nr:probable acyl-activating enzyme 1, peroxisomal isoform X2 [Amborella trichopoda]ERN17787.1 hypothetical protein AMTR_s00047p00149040 [Amborella trichopoda]|eukprot:XP_020530509.1 probable acyl-activating enzyme 1, peroxisomal isoform X2 [Amborella trichopoda]